MSRHVVIVVRVCVFFSFFSHRATNCLRVQVVSLGAGKDTLFFRLKDGDRAPSGGYFEVDFEAVTTWKSRLIAKTPALSSMAAGEDDGLTVSLSLFFVCFFLKGLKAYIGVGPARAPSGAAFFFAIGAVRCF